MVTFTYVLVSVIIFENDVEKSICATDKEIQLPIPGGYLSSTHLAPGHGGSETCPWIISLPLGQNVRFVLYAFSNRNIYSTTQPTPDGSSVDPSEAKCSAYLYIYDNNDRNIINLCDGYSSERHIYTSTSNELKVYVMTTVEDAGNFVVQYHGESP